MERPAVDPGVAAVLAVLNSPGITPMEAMGPVEARAQFKKFSAGSDGSPIEGSTCLDRSIPGPAGDIPVRVITPAAGDPHGVLVWFHGGGFVIGDLDTSEGIARPIAADAQCVVVSVDYRLAPEAPAPAAADDCWAALSWVAENLTELGLAAGSPIAVGGDSAGGNLAAVVAQRALAEGGPELCFQLLVYPVTDLTASSPSVVENGEGYFLTASVMAWFSDQYLSGGVAADDPSVSPFFASDDATRGLPPALVVVAGYDPLRDEGRAYGERLAGLGVMAEVVEYPTMIHGFFSMAAFTPIAIEALNQSAAALSSAIARASG